jgi:pyruvate dehydrogenase E2 component (dihydrolipoamide acetyltransferase)/2-oxoisovalerate dehydrogenase E2 component (dihydrolipoyl transacylase)
MDFPLPELGEGVYEAEMTRWLVKTGDVVKPGQALLEVLTDKATMEVPAPFAGTITELKVQPGDKLSIGQVVLTYGAKEAAQPPAPRKAKPSVPATAPSMPAPLEPTNGPPAAGAAHVAAAPAVRQMARKLGIDLAKVRGTGPHGRILIDDLAIAIPAAGKSPEAPVDFGTGKRVKLQGVRRKIAEHLVRSKRIVPHYTYVDECEVTELVALREQRKETFAAQGAKLTYLAFFVKAAAAALKEVPTLNSSLDDAAGEIVLHDHVNISIAVAAPTGLIVPVIHDAARRDLLDIAKEIERLSADARAGKSKLEDLRGGTFTITSIGNLGGLFATPIINHPEVGILGVGKIVKRPVFDDKGEIRAADMVYLSLAFDHRVVDGAVAVEFGNAIMQRLRQPEQLI